MLANPVNSESKKGFTVPQVAEKQGWRETHIIQVPMSSERFEAGTVAAMQKKRILGVTSRYVIIAKKVDYGKK